MSDSALRFCARCATPLAPREDGGRTRLACPKEGCGWVHYGNPLPVVAAIVQHGDDVLLVRNVGWPEGWYGLVTGFLEAGEAPEDGMLRELREELGLTDARIAGFVGVYPFFERNELILAYHVVAQGEVTAGPELAGYKRVPLAKLRPWPFGTGQAVRDFLERRQAGGA